MTLRVLFFLLISIFFTSCTSTGKVAADLDKKIVFGNGGGFTGLYITHELKSDGRVFILLADSSQKQVNKLGKKQTREIFALADKIREAHSAFSHPSNRTFYINYYFDKGVVEYKWGDPEMPVSDQIKDFYNQLNAIVK